MHRRPRVQTKRSLLLTPALALVVISASACSSPTEPCPVGFVRLGEVCLRGCPPGSLRADGGCDCPDGLLSRETPVGLVCEPPMDGGQLDMGMNVDAADMGALEDGSTDANAGDGADDAGACVAGLPCELEGLECALGQTSCETGEETCEPATSVDFGAECGRPACANCVCASGDCIRPLGPGTTSPTRSRGERLASFGAVSAVSGDGTLLVVGAPTESTAAGFEPGEGPVQDTLAPGSGAVFVFRREPDDTWAFERMLKAAVPRAGDAPSAAEPGARLPHPLRLPPHGRLPRGGRRRGVGRGSPAAAHRAAGGLLAPDRRRHRGGHGDAGRHHSAPGNAGRGGPRAAGDLGAARCAPDPGPQPRGDRSRGALAHRASGAPAPGPLRRRRRAHRRAPRRLPQGRRPTAVRRGHPPARCGLWHRARGHGQDLPGDGHGRRCVPGQGGPAHHPHAPGRRGRREARLSPGRPRREGESPTSARSTTRFTR